MTWHTSNLALDQVQSMLGEEHPLVAQLDCSEGIMGLRAATDSLHLAPVDDPETLRAFLRHYRAHVLEAIELPAIYRAYTHAASHHSRELVALDQSLARDRMLCPLAAASIRVGRHQLKRLRPLHDQRVVQRYLRAVEEGRAHGWHTLVYGLTLAIYSIPPRQGLVVYTRQTLHGFIATAMRPLGINETEAALLLGELCENLQSTVEEMVQQNPCCTPFNG